MLLGTGQNRTPYKRTRALGFRDVRANEPGEDIMLSGPTTKRENIRYGNRLPRQSNWRGITSTSDFSLVKLSGGNSTPRL